MSILAAAKSTFSISTTTTAPSSYDASGYGNLTFAAVGSIESLDAFGDSYADVSFASLSDGRTQHRKGVADAGTMSITVALDSGDTGQTNLKTAVDDTGNLPFHFQVGLNDQITPSSGNPTTYYFSGFVSEYKVTVGSVNDVVKVSFTVMITTETVVDAAT